MQVRHKTLRILSGCVWFIIGLSLLRLGISLLMNCMESEHLHSAWLSYCTRIIGSKPEAIAFLIAGGLFLGYIKGKTVLKKSALESCTRIERYENPTLANIYTLKNYILIAVMISLGMLMKIFHLPNDIRGFIDVAVGTALMQGSLFYFRFQSALNSAKSL